MKPANNRRPHSWGPEKPAHLLDPKNAEALRRVIRSRRAFDRRALIDLVLFKKLLFRHPLFRGTGEELLRFAGINATREDYFNWMATLFPEAAAARLLYQASPTRINRSGECEYAGKRFYASCLRDDAVRELRAVRGAFSEAYPVSEAWHALCPLARDPMPDAVLELAETVAKMRDVLESLTGIQRCVLMMRTGVYDGQELTSGEIGDRYGLSPGRIETIWREALRLAYGRLRKVV